MVCFVKKLHLTVAKMIVGTAILCLASTSVMTWARPACVMHCSFYLAARLFLLSSSKECVAHYRFYLAARLFLLFSSKEWTNVVVSEGADIWIKKSVCCISIDTMTQASMGMEIFVHCLRCQASLHLKSLEVTWSCAVTAGFVRGQPNVNTWSCAVTAGFVRGQPNVNICSCAVTAGFVRGWPNVNICSCAVTAGFVRGLSLIHISEPTRRA